MSLTTRPLTIPAAMAPALRPVSGRWIDPRGQRFGAATSAVTLVVALAIGAWSVAAAGGLFLALSATFGTRWFIFSRPWPTVRSVLRLGPSELEHEMPPRFAQALGAAFVGAGSALLALGVSPAGWVPIGAVIGLQGLLASTGYCLGCRLFFLRWWVPDLFARVVGRGMQREALRYIKP